MCVCVGSSRINVADFDFDHCGLLPPIFLQERLEWGTSCTQTHKHTCAHETIFYPEIFWNGKASGQVCQTQSSLGPLLVLSPCRSATSALKWYNICNIRFFLLNYFVFFPIIYTIIQKCKQKSVYIFICKQLVQYFCIEDNWTTLSVSWRHFISHLISFEKGPVSVATVLKCSPDVLLLLLLPLCLSGHGLGPMV